MPERGFDSSFWGDGFIQSLPKDAKYLYAYLWTNHHCNQAGLYELTLKTIAFETDLGEASLPDLLKLLESRVVWYPESNLVWVKNFIKHQTKSPKFLIAAARCLSQINNNGLAKEVIEYNYNKYSISIPYPYTTTTVPIPPSASASTNTISNTSTDAKGDRGIVKGDKGTADVFQFYEQNMGRLTPSVVERLKDLMKEYLPQSVLEAMREAVRAEHRNLRYTEGILERRSKELGGPVKKDDPNRFVKGKYGHMVKR